MKTITLRNISENGAPLEVTYLPEMGMNMASYKKGDIEIIDQSTKPQFEDNFSGLGPLIGPHFYRRRPEVLPKLADEKAFSHIARIKEKDTKTDPFTHGVGRYAPWSYEHDENSIKATLKGSDTWAGLTLKEIEGQDFTMTFTSTLTPKGLNINFSVVSEADSIVGIHYYYHLPQGRGRVIGKVKNQYLDINEIKTIPTTWNFDPSTHELEYILDKHTDFAFHPFPDPTIGDILLDTETYQLRTQFESVSEECSFQLYHPKGASFVCVEPTSAQDPRHANLTVSSIKISLEIL